MPRGLIGRDIYDAYLVNHPGVKAWEQTSKESKIDHEKVAQALNVKLELTAAGLQEYLFIFEGMTTIADLAGLSTLIDVMVSPFEPFEIIVLENGCEVGYGWYGMGEARQLFAARLAKGEGQGLLTRLNELRAAYI